MNDLDKLFDLLTKTKLYTNSKEEFIEKYSTPENQDKLFDVVSKTKLYTDSKENFMSKYFPTTEPPKDEGVISGEELLKETDEPKGGSPEAVDTTDSNFASGGTKFSSESEFNRRYPNIKPITEEGLDEDKAKADSEISFEELIKPEKKEVSTRASLKNQLDEIKSKQLDIEKRDQRLGLQGDLSTTSGDMEFLNKEASRVESLIEGENELLEKMSDGTSLAKSLLFKALPIPDAKGLYENLFGKDSVELDERVQEEVLLKLDSDKRLKESIAYGSKDQYISIPKKEAIIKEARFNAFQKEYKESLSRVDKIKKDYEGATTFSDKANLNEEYQKEASRFNALKGKYSIELLKDGSLNTKDVFKTTTEGREWREGLANNKFFDLYTTAGDMLTDITADYLLSGAAALASIGDAATTAITGDDSYGVFDKLGDVSYELADMNLFPNSEQESGKLFKENGDLNLSFYSAPKQMIDGAGFTLALMIGLKGGKTWKNYERIGRAINPKKAGELAMALKSSKRAYQLTLNSNLQDAKDLGLDGGDALMFQQGVSAITGLVSLINPDFKLTQTAAGKSILTNLAGNLKGAVTNKARKAAVGKFVKDVMILEPLEEITEMIGRDVIASSMVAGYTPEILKERAVKELIVSTMVQTTPFSVFGFRGNRKRTEAKYYKAIEKNFNGVDGISSTLDQMINTAKDENLKEALIESKQIMTDITRAVNNSPENVTAEQVNLLTEKAKVVREMEGVDEAFRPEYKEKIEAINEKIREAGVSGKEAREKVSEVTKKIKDDKNVQDKEINKTEDKEAKDQDSQEGVQEVTTTKKTTKVSEAINRPVTVTTLGGSKLDTPIEGDMYVEGQQVVIEDADGNITELGNVDEVSDSTLEELGIEYKEAQVEVTKEGKLKMEGKEYSIQEDLPTSGIEYNSDGTIKTVSVKDSEGKPTQFDGSIAEDLGYQILLKEAMSPEQNQVINEKLEQDEEFQNKLREAEESTKERTDKDTTEVTEQTKSEPEVKKENKLTEGTKRVLKQVELAKKAIKKILPNLEFVVHNTNADLKKATGQVAGGVFERSANDKSNKIHISLEGANDRTVAHEVFHAVLANKLGSESRIQKVTADMVSRLSKNLDPKTNETLIRFMNKYKDTNPEDMNEEFVSELFGMLANDYTKFDRSTKHLVKRWLNKVAEQLGLGEFIRFKDTARDEEVMQLLETVAGKVSLGEVVSEGDLIILSKQGSQGVVGTIKIKSQKGSKRKSKNPKKDPRPWVRNIVDTVEMESLTGESFITNMYDFTTAGVVELGLGIKAEFFGGRNYVPYMMNKTGKGLGEVSNLAAFNSKTAAEGFVNSSKKSGASLFAPHIGTMEGSWQFQHHIFETLVDLVLDNKLISKGALIKEWNSIIKSKEGKKLLAQFNTKNRSKIRSFNSFSKNPKGLVDLLNIENNYSPNLRKALNDKLVGIKEIKTKLGVKNKIDILNKLVDPLNEGSSSFDIMSIVRFDPKTLEIVKTKVTDPDHHPSFGWTVKAKIERVMQPDFFYKSFDITDSYTKYNTGGTTTSKKTDFESIDDYSKSNVSSSAGAIPKVGVFKSTMKSQKIRDDYFKDLKETKASDPKQYWSVDMVPDSTKGEVVEVEGGKAFVGTDGDIKGVFKFPNSKEKGVAQKLLAKAVEMGGTKLDNFDNYLTKQYKKAGFRVVSRTPFNEQYAPEGWDKELHGTPPVVAMVYDPNNEMNIEVKEFPNLDTGYDQMIEYRDNTLEKSTFKSQIIGESAQLRDNAKKNLSVAREMESKGKKTKAIWAATGWERGADNKWRYEIDDSLFEIKYDFKEISSGELDSFRGIKIKNRVIKKILRTWNGRKWDKSSERDVRRRLSEDSWAGMSNFSNKEVEGAEAFINSLTFGEEINPAESVYKDEYTYSFKGKLKDIIKSGELLEMYPQLGDLNMNLEVQSYGSKNSDYKGYGYEGHYSPDTGILIRTAAKGKTPKDTLNKFIELGNHYESTILHEIQHAIQEIEGFSKGGNVNNRTYEEYRRLGGEVEARNVQKRMMKMSKEERKETPLSETEDVARDSQILIKGLGDSTFKSQKTDKENYDKGREGFERSRQEIGNKYKTVTRRFKDFMAKSYDASVDRQGLVKKALKKIGLNDVVSYMVTRAGAASFAKSKIEDAYKKTFSDLTADEWIYLEEIIQLKRTISIEKNRADRGLEMIDRMGGFDAEMSESALREYKRVLGDDVYAKLEKRSENYFTVFKDILKDMKSEGLINQEFYDRFAEVDYKPTAYVKFLLDMDGDFLETEADRVGSFGLSGDMIRNMKKGSVGLEVMDAWGLLQGAMITRTKANFANRLNSTFAEEFEKTSKRADKLVKKDKSDLTKEEAKFLEDFANVKANVKMDSFVYRTKKDGTVVQKFKSEGKNNKGWKFLYYYKDGVKNRVQMKEEFFNKFTDTSLELMPSGTKDVISTLSGTKLVKSLATGNNPLFFITNLPRDFMFTLMFSKEYSNNIPLNTLKLLRDMTKGIKDVVTDSDSYKKYLEYGGGMDFLSLQGRYKEGTLGQKMISKVLSQKSVDKITQNKALKAFGKFNLASEAGLRLVVFNKSIQNQLKDLGVKNISEVKDKKQVDLIYTNAVRSAREMTDFNQGGTVSKAVDSFVPYLNASIQGTRTATREIKERPWDFAIRAAWMAGISSSFALSASMSIMFLTKGDEEDEDMKLADKYFKTLETVSEYDLRNYFIIPLGVKDSNKNWKYLRVAKSHFMTPLINATEHAQRKFMAAQTGNKYYEELGKTLKGSVSNNILPIIPDLDVTQRIPAVGAGIAMLGIDPYTGNNLDWKRGEVYTQNEGIVDDRVDPMYKAIGLSLGVAPARLQKATESFITSPSVNLYVGASYVIGNMTSKALSSHDLGDYTITETFTEPLFRRLVKSGSDYNYKSKVLKPDTSEGAEVDRAVIYRKKGVKEAGMLIKEGKSEEALKKITELIEKYPEDAKLIRAGLKNEIAKKSKHPIINEILFERNPKKKAFMLYQLFGDDLVDIGSKDKELRETFIQLRKDKAITRDVLKYYFDHVSEVKSKK